MGYPLAGAAYSWQGHERRRLAAADPSKRVRSIGPRGQWRARRRPPSARVWSTII